MSDLTDEPPMRRVLAARRALRYAGRAVARRVVHEWRGQALASRHGAQVATGVTIVSLDNITIGEGASLKEGVELHVDPGPDTRLRIGARCRIGPRTEFRVLHGDQLEIGEFSSIAGASRLVGSITIGRHCLFARNIFASTHNHEFRAQGAVYIRDQDQRAAAAAERIVVDDDVWIGWGVVIMGDVHVGRGAIVGANAVVTRDVSPYAIVGGVPAKTLGQRASFDPPAEIRADVVADRPYFYSGFPKEPAELGLRIDDRVGRCVMTGRSAAGRVIVEGHATRPTSIRIVTTAPGTQGARVASHDVVDDFAITSGAESDQCGVVGTPSFLRDFTNVLLEATPGDVFVRRVQLA